MAHSVSPRAESSLCQPVGPQIWEAGFSGSIFSHPSSPPAPFQRMLQKLSHPSHLDLYQIRDFLYHWLKSLFLSVLYFFPCSYDLRYKCTMPTRRKMRLALILSDGSGSWFRTVVAVESVTPPEPQKGIKVLWCHTGLLPSAAFLGIAVLGPCHETTLEPWCSWF